MAQQVDDQIFDLDLINRQRPKIADGHAFLIDRSTQAEYGPLDSRHFAREDIESKRTTEIGNQEFRIAGLFDLGTGLAANGAVLMSDRGFQRLIPWNTNERISLGLIQLSKSANPLKVKQDLHRRLSVSNDLDTTTTPELTTVEVLTRQEMLDLENKRWLWQTPIGLIFQLGVGLSLLVGAAIVYMVLATDVANRLSEYATLLAMGYSRRYLASVVMTQAIVLAVLGFFCAWGTGLLLYEITTQFSGIPMHMNWMRVVLVAGLGTAMCCVSGILALRKLWKAEPANLF
ncbi:MAG: FtsX-like permease family protein [Planctomycetales bacterium]|nr:FtsX-like permease family protein [Planctomycetales bacterium]